MISQTVAKQMLEALIEASSLFDNYPELYEMIGTYQVIHAAIDAGLHGTTRQCDYAVNVLENQT